MSFKSGRRPVISISHCFYGITRDVNRAKVRCKFHFFTHEALQTVSNTAKRTDQSVCDSWKKCPLCCAHYHINSKKRHKCYHVSCTSCCGEFKHLNHRCYIQPIVEEEPQEQEDDPLEEPLQWQCEDERERKQCPPPHHALS